MDVIFLWWTDKKTILKKCSSTDTILPVDGDMVIIKEDDFFVKYKRIDYDENLITIYCDG